MPSEWAVVTRLEENPPNVGSVRELRNDDLAAIPGGEGTTLHRAGDGQ